MALIFSSGGGRLGNQLLNLIHLQALLFEYDIDIFKVNDSFIIGKEKSFIYKLEKNKINWSIVSDYSKSKKFDKLVLLFFIRILHIYYYLHRKRNSYKLTYSHKFIFGKRLKKDFSRNKLIQESKEK